MLRFARIETIGEKISMAMTCVIVGAMLIIVFTTLAIIRSQLLERTEMNAEKDLQIITEKLDMFFERVENDAVFMLTSDSSQALFKRSEKAEKLDAAEWRRISRAINESLSTVLERDGVYRSVVFYDVRGSSYVTGDVAAVPELLEANRAEILEFLKGKENRSWRDPQKSPWIISGQKGDFNCIAYRRKVYSMDSGRLVGAIELELQNGAISALYKSIAQGENQVYLLNSGGVVISSDEEDSLFKNFYIEIHDPAGHPAAGKRMTEENGYFYAMRDYSGRQWKIVLATGQSSYKNSLEAFATAGALISALLLVVIALISYKLIKSITRPIGVITDTIKRIGRGDYSRKIEVKTSGELKTLADEFNRMLLKTNELMAQIRITEEKKRENELNLIQLQITPHFLYNIIESVCGLIVMDEKDTAIKMLRHLSDFYRGVLGRGREIITLGEELAIAKHYLRIMQICHPDTFEYYIHIEDGLKMCRINKLTLQPLLENAVYHGIVASGRQGYIGIYASKREDTVILTVEDDGEGIPPGKLETLYTNTGGEPADSFGIRNTDSRIKLYFGQEYGIGINSAPKEGTSVTVRLPFQSVMEESGSCTMF